MTDRHFISQFSPQWTKPEFLEAILVQRDGLIRESVDLIRESVLTGNKHHLLFIGPRGIGKTHLVKLIHHRLSLLVEEDAALRENLRFAWLNEDEIATSFLRLLLLIYRNLSERYPEEFSAKTLTGIIGQDPATAQELLGQALLRDLGVRTVVLIVENLDSLFRVMPAAELKNWRAFVQNHPVFATVATAQMLFDGVSDRDEPFFGFFDTRHLESLSVDEARSLLENIARLHPDRADLLEYLQTPQGRSRVSAIHELSGGNPRLFVIFSELFTHQQDLDGLVRPFEEMVDRQLTSFYQERLRWLSPQQREIIQLLSRTGHPVPVKQIADGLFTTHNSITGQLRQLRDMRYLNFRQNGREVFYELAEPLMRLALQVKETNDRRPLALIVDFLRVAFEREEIETRLAACDPASRGYAYYASAKAAMDAGLPNPRLEILSYQLEILPPDQCDDATLATVRDAAEDLNEPAVWNKLGLVLNARKEWEEAVPVFTRVIVMESATPTEIAKALYRRGYANFYAGRLEEAIADCTSAMGLPEAPAKSVAWALFNRGFTHGQAGRTEEEIADYTRAIELPGAPVEPVAMALVFRGIKHGQAGRTEEEIADYTRAIELKGAPAEQVAKALNNRGVSHGQAGQTEDAIADWTRVIELPGAPVEELAIALNNRGVRRGQAGQTEDAIADWTCVIEMPGAPVEELATALNNRGARHGQMGRTEDAIADWTRVIALPGALAEHVTKAFYNRGVTLRETGRTEQAILDWTCVIEVPGAPVHEVTMALNNLSFANRDAGKPDGVLKNFGRLFALPDHAAVSKVLTHDQLTYIAKAVVNAISSHSSDHQQWAAKITEFLSRFTCYNGLPQLGDALVQHLPALAESPLNHAAWDAWADCWESSWATMRPSLEAKDQDRLAIPLRLLRTGIDYLKTKQENRLLALPMEERHLLRKALGLPKEKN